MTTALPLAPIQPAPDLPVRRLLVDLETPLPRHWNGGDAFRTAWFNALSMSFPVGEQFFIDAVKLGMKALPQAQREALAAEVQGFIGQEATHRRLHALFNAHLQQQGHQVIEIKGFANMVVHAGGQAGVTVARHGIGRHGKDG